MGCFVFPNIPCLVRRGSCHRTPCISHMERAVTWLMIAELLIDEHEACKGCGRN